MKKIILTCLTALGGLLSPLMANEASYIAIEANTGKILYSKGAEEKRPISSLAQVATALVALDWLERTKVRLDQNITVPQEAYIFHHAGNPMQLRPGDRITLRDALYSTLLGSDNVSSLAIASFVGRDLSYRRGGGNPIDLFVKEMNNLADGLGMKKTRFYAPHGMDAKGAVSQSCAVDIVLLGSYAMQNAAFSFIVKHASRQVSVQTSSGPKLFNIVNTNTLLKTPGVDGIKTGNSRASGPCLLITATRNAQPKKDPLTGTENIYPQRIVLAVLGTAQRNQIALNLIREGWQAWDAWSAAGMPTDDQKEFLRFPIPRKTN